MYSVAKLMECMMCSRPIPSHFFMASSMGYYRQSKPALNSPTPSVEWLPSKKSTEPKVTVLYVNMVVE